MLVTYILINVNLLCVQILLSDQPCLPILHRNSISQPNLPVDRSIGCAFGCLVGRSVSDVVGRVANWLFACLNLISHWIGQSDGLLLTLPGNSFLSIMHAIFTKQLSLPNLTTNFAYQLHLLISEYKCHSLTP